MASPSRRELLLAAGGLIGAGTITGTATGTRDGRVTGRRVVQAGWGQQAKLAAADGESRDEFGSSVAVAGDTALVGAPLDVNSEGDRTGSAYVFERTDGEWSQQAKLIDDDGQQLDAFGDSVALAGDTALIGVPGETDVNGTAAGAVYVFERTDGEWTETTVLFPGDGDSEDRFGNDLAVAGDTALVGAPGDEDPNGDDAGSAYVFQRTDSGWTERAKLAANDGDSEDNFGASVALADGIALVGAANDEDPHGERGGAAYVFEGSGGDWEQASKLTASDGDSRDDFGMAVALTGETALIGAPADEDPNGLLGGSAYVFERAGGAWTERTKLAPENGGEEDFFGRTVAMAGDTAVVSAVLDADPNGERAGSAYVFERTDGGWRERVKLLPTDGDDRDVFGSAVAVADDTALVGAPGDEDPNGDDAGSAYVFQRTDSGWTERAKLAANDGDSEDNFGASVALADGIALVGAANDEDPHGERGGAAYVFEGSGGDWEQASKLTASDGDSRDDFGMAVALTGETALIGAPADEDPNGLLGGSAYVFERAGGAWTERTKLAPENGGEEDFFGRTVAMAGDTAVVSAVLDADPNGERAGSAYVFERTDGGWRERVKLLPTDGDDRDVFGSAVAVADDTALIGAAADEDPNGSDAGSAYVFTATSGDAPPTATPTSVDPTTPTPSTASPTPAGRRSPTPVTASPTPAGRQSPTPVTASPTPAGRQSPPPETATSTATPAAGGEEAGDGEDGGDGEDDAATTGSGPGLGGGGALATVAAAVGLGWWQRREDTQ